MQKYHKTTLLLTCKDGFVHNDIDMISEYLNDFIQWQVIVSDNYDVKVYLTGLFTIQ